MHRSFDLLFRLEWILWTVARVALILWTVATVTLINLLERSFLINVSMTIKIHLRLLSQQVSFWSEFLVWSITNPRHGECYNTREAAGHNSVSPFPAVFPAGVKWMGKGVGQCEGRIRAALALFEPAHRSPRFLD